MLALNNELLSFDGLIAAFQRDVLKNETPGRPPLLQQFKNKLRAVYFAKNTPDAEVISGLTAVRFADYPALREALQLIFSMTDKSEIETKLQAIVPTTVPDEKTASEWSRLNNEFGYFPEHEPVPALYHALVQRCRTMVVLIEQNNNPEDTLAYEYAYRLMVLFNETTLDKIAEKTTELITATGCAKQATAYHDVLLNQVALPDGRHLADLAGWREFLHKNQRSSASAALRLFAEAPAIESQMEKVTGRLNAPASLKQAQDLYALCHYQRAAENPALAQLCKAYRIPESAAGGSFNACLDFLKTVTWPLKTQDNLPEAEVTLQDDSGEYVWTRLPPDDYRALFLGVITSCCQNIGGNSEQCVKDAVSLPDNGLYVLLKRKPGKSGGAVKLSGAINYQQFEIVGQSYAWMSKTGNLTLDSFESSRGRVPSAVAKNLLKQFTDQIFHDHPDIKFVTLGQGGATPSDLGFSASAIPERIRNGYQYGDSYSQYEIASRPILASNVSDEAWQVALSNMSAESSACIEYLSHYLTREELLRIVADDPSFAGALNYFSLQRLIALSPQLNTADLLPIDAIQLAQQPTSHSLARLAWRDMTPTQLADYLPYIVPEDQRTKVIKLQINTLLAAAKGHPKAFDQMLNALPAAQRLAVLTDVLKNNRLSVLRHPDSLQLILDLYPDESQRLAALNTTDARGETLLFRAVKHPESLKILLALYPGNEQRLALVNKKDPEGQSLLTKSTEKFESFEIIAKLYPNGKELYTALIGEHKNNRKFETFFYHQSLMGYVPKQLRNELLEMNQDMLYLFVERPKILAEFLYSLPKANRFDAITASEPPRKWTILHSACSYPKSLAIILNSLPLAQRFQALSIKNSANLTPIDFIAQSPDALVIMLKYLPPADLVKLPGRIIALPTVRQFIAKQELAALRNPPEENSPQSGNTI